MEIQNMSEEEWEILDYYCYEEEKEEDGKWWKMVMEAGKKLVITGVVISSAPVVLPPLLVVSALGFAMSLPFGVVFASYACTHKLMTKLLPPPPPPPPSPSPSPYEVDLEEEAEEEMMMIKKEIEMRIELQVDDESDVQVGGESEKDIGEKNKLEEEREIDESSTSTSTSSENENGSVNIDEDTKQSKELDSEKIKQQIISMNDDAAISSSLDKQHNRTTHEVLPAAAAAAAVVDVDVDPDHRGDEEDLKIVGEVNDKEWESKIWEKINAIRVIVGFKAPRRSSYLEEVKALYLFTGIDPPSTSESHQLDDNLCFLMSVIGLK